MEFFFGKRKKEEPEDEMIEPDRIMDVSGQFQLPTGTVKLIRLNFSLEGPLSLVEKFREELPKAVAKAKKGSVFIFQLIEYYRLTTTSLNYFPITKAFEALEKKNVKVILLAEPYEEVRFLEASLKKPVTSKPFVARNLEEVAQEIERSLKP